MKYHHARKTLKAYILIGLLLLFPLSIAAQEVKGNFPTWQVRGPLRDAVGVKAGFFSEGNIYLNSQPYTNQLGLHGGIFFDIRVGGKFFVSPTLDVIDINLFDEREMFLDLSLAIKHAFLSRSQRLLWRPTVAAGYGYMSDIAFLKITNYLTLKSSCEIIFITSKRYSYLLELGMFGLPAGGNADTEVRANVHLFLRAGILY